MITGIVEKPNIEQIESDFEKIRQQLERQLQSSNISQEAVSLVFLEMAKLFPSKKIYQLTDDFDEATRLSIIAEQWIQAGDLILKFANDQKKLLETRTYCSIQNLVRTLKGSGRIFLGYSKLIHEVNESRNPDLLDNYAEGFSIIANAVLEDWEFISDRILKEIKDLTIDVLQYILQVELKLEIIQAELDLENKVIKALNNPSLLTIKKSAETILAITREKNLQYREKSVSSQEEDNVDKSHQWDREAQIDKNKSAMELMRKWIDEDKSQQETNEKKEYFELFQEIIDNERLPGCKLYSNQ